MTAGLLYDELGVRECSDLYTLTAERLKKLDGFKTKKINNLLSAVENSKNIPLERFLFALGIDGVGKVAAKDLAKAYQSVAALGEASPEQLTELENIGEVTAQAVYGWFSDEQNRAEIQRLISLGVNPTYKKKENAAGAFAGQFVVLTGTLNEFKRGDAQKLIEERGGECQSSVTSKTTLVIAGEAAGSKLEKAKKLGVKIIDEAAFKAML